MRPSWLVSKASGRPSPVVSYLAQGHQCHPLVFLRDLHTNRAAMPAMFCQNDSATCRAVPEHRPKNWRGSGRRGLLDVAEREIVL